MTKQESKARRDAVFQILWDAYEQLFGEPPPMLTLSNPEAQIREALRTGKKPAVLPTDEGLSQDAVY